MRWLQLDVSATLTFGAAALLQIGSDGGASSQKGMAHAAGQARSIPGSQQQQQQLPQQDWMQDLSQPRPRNTRVILPDSADAQVRGHSGSISAAEGDRRPDALSSPACFGAAGPRRTQALQDTFPDLTGQLVAVEQQEGFRDTAEAAHWPQPEWHLFLQCQLAAQLGLRQVRQSTKLQHAPCEWQAALYPDDDFSKGGVGPAGSARHPQVILEATQKDHGFLSWALHLTTPIYNVLRLPLVFPRRGHPS